MDIFWSWERNRDPVIWHVLYNVSEGKKIYVYAMDIFGVRKLLGTGDCGSSSR